MSRRAMAHLRLKRPESLLASTAKIREICDAYLSFLPSGRDVAEAVATMRRDATESQYAESIAWSNDRVVLIPHGHVYYQAASLLIATQQDRLEQQPENFHGRSPHDVTERRLMLRIQYIASRIANEPGWTWPIVSVSS